MQRVKAIRIQIKNEHTPEIEVRHLQNFFVEDGKHYIMENLEYGTFETYIGIVTMLIEIPPVRNFEEDFRLAPMPLFERLLEGEIIGIQVVFANNEVVNYTTRMCNIEFYEKKGSMVIQIIGK